MSNYNSLKATIDANIKTNGNQEITGAVLNYVLNEVVTILGDGYQFKGIATTSTNPGTPDARVFYLAGAGTYTHFGQPTIQPGNLGVFWYDSAWHTAAIDVAPVIDIVNNFTDGGADKALSAEMGKVLHDIVDSNGTPSTETPIDVSSLQSCGGVINNGTGKWVTLSGYDASLIPKSVFAGYQYIKITPAAANPTGIAFTINGFSSGSSVQYASGTSYQSISAGGSPQTIPIPQDANYIYIPLEAQGSRKPAALALIAAGSDRGLVQKVQDLENRVEESFESIDDLSVEINGDPTHYSGTFSDWQLYGQYTPNRYYKIGNDKTYEGGIIVFKLTNYTTYKIGVVIQDGTSYLSNAISDTGWKTEGIVKTIGANEDGYYIRVTIARQDNTNMSPGEFLSVIEELSYEFYKGDGGLESRVQNLEDESVYKHQRIPMAVMGTDKYVGKRIDLADRPFTYEILGTLSTSGTGGQGRQGAAVFGDYLFQFHNTNNAVVVFKISTGQNIQTISLTADANNHANTAGFSGQKYNPNDAFPCVYVSSESQSKVYLYRITGEEGNFALSLVQTLSFAVPYYYPNMTIDAPNNRGIIVGYKENSWQSPDGNRMMCCCFDLPDVTDGDVTLANPYGEFSFPFIYAAQGAVARYGKIYQSFGNTNYGMNICGIVSIDYLLKNVESFIDLGVIGNIEPEGLSIQDGGFILTTNERGVYKITPQ